MRKAIDDQSLENVVGGTVILNTSKMRIGFTYHQKAYDLVNCTDDEAQHLLVDLYTEFKNDGDKVFEEKVMEAFSNNGWI